jgi:hypothetical protein
MPTNQTFFSISWKDAKALVESGKLKIIGSNLGQINNQGEFTITADQKKLYKRRNSASKVIFDLIAKK